MIFYFFNIPKFTHYFPLALNQVFSQNIIKEELILYVIGTIAAYKSFIDYLHSLYHIPG